jgi:hypothetical protein
MRARAHSGVVSRRALAGGEPIDLARARVAPNARLVTTGRGEVLRLSGCAGAICALYAGVSLGSRDGSQRRLAQIALQEGTSIFRGSLLPKRGIGRKVVVRVRVVVGNPEALGQSSTERRLPHPEAPMTLIRTPLTSRIVSVARVPHLRRRRGSNPTRAGAVGRWRERRLLLRRRLFFRRRVVYPAHARRELVASDTFSRPRCLFVTHVR